MVELWSDPLAKRYSNSRCSIAYVFWLGYYICLLLVPFYAAYASHSFWVKQAVYQEQPATVFEQRAVVLLEGVQAATGAPVVLGWSTMPEFNALLDPDTQALRAPADISAWSRDADHDGRADAHSVNITLPLRAGEVIHRATAWLFFRAATDGALRLNMAGAAVISHASPLPAAGLAVRGALGIDFLHAVPSHRTRTTYAEPLLAPATLRSAADITPAAFYAAVAARNETLAVRKRTPPLWTPEAAAVAAQSPSRSFSLSVLLAVPAQDIVYQPGAAETLKFAWVQYLALFLLLAWAMSYLRAFVFRYQVVPTFVAADTRPPQKAHQF